MTPTLCQAQAELRTEYSHNQRRGVENQGICTTDCWKKCVYCARLRVSDLRVDPRRPMKNCAGPSCQSGRIKNKPQKSRFVKKSCMSPAPQIIREDKLYFSVCARVHVSPIPMKKPDGFLPAVFQDTHTHTCLFSYICRVRLFLQLKANKPQNEI